MHPWGRIAAAVVLVAGLAAADSDLGERTRPGAERDLGDVTVVIDKDQLTTGDALVAPGRYVRLIQRSQSVHRGAPTDYAYTPVRYLGAAA